MIKVPEAVKPFVDVYVTQTFLKGGSDSKKSSLEGVIADIEAIADDEDTKSITIALTIRHAELIQAMAAEVEAKLEDEG